MLAPLLVRELGRVSVCGMVLRDRDHLGYQQPLSVDRCLSLFGAGSIRKELQDDAAPESALQKTSKERVGFYLKRRLNVVHQER